MTALNLPQLGSQQKHYLQTYGAAWWDEENGGSNLPSSSTVKVPGVVETLLLVEQSQAFSANVSESWVSTQQLNLQQLTWASGFISSFSVNPNIHVSKNVIL